jgi:hypothetical protein
MFKTALTKVRDWFLSQDLVSKVSLALNVVLVIALLLK